MRKLLTAMTAAVLVACGGNANGGNGTPGSFAGTVVPPFPDGLASAGTQRFPRDPVGAYALDLVFGADRQMLWLTRATAGDGTTAVREVVAVLEIPREEQNVSLVYAPGACSVHGRPDREVVALARVTFTPVLEEVVFAWRANRAAGRFEDVLASDVTCRNPRYPDGGPTAS